MSRISEPKRPTVTLDIRRHLIRLSLVQCGLLADVSVDVIALTPILPIPRNAHVILPTIRSTVTRDVLVASNNSLPHRVVRSEILEKPGLEAAGLEVTVRHKGVPGCPVGDVVDGEEGVGFGGVALDVAGVVEFVVEETDADVGLGGVGGPAEGAAVGVFGAFVFALLDAGLSVGIGTWGFVEEVAAVGAWLGLLYKGTWC